MNALNDLPVNAMIVPDWPAPARVRALTTTRLGVGSTANAVAGPMGAEHGAYAAFNLGSHVGDDASLVAGNRARLRAVLPAEPVWLDQVHGNTVIDAPGAVSSGVASDAAPEADAAVTRASGTVLAILSADCLPVLLCDRAGTVVAVAHAGWRGLAAGVIENAVRAMAVPVPGVMAWLGPAIGPRAYEVGADVVEAFTHDDPGAASAFVARPQGKFLADLYALARRRLSKLGVLQVWGGEACTYSEPARFYSFRRDGRTGRMASLIWMEG